MLMVVSMMFQIFDLLFFRNSGDYSVQICQGVVQMCSVLASDELETGDGEDPRCSTRGHRPQLCQPQPRALATETRGTHLLSSGATSGHFRQWMHRIFNDIKVITKSL